MRLIGTLPGHQAAIFADYLLTEGIDTLVDLQPGGSGVWIINEADVGVARAALAQYTAASDDARYHDSTERAAEIRKQSARRQAQAGKNVHEVGKEWSAAQFFGRPRPLTIALIAVCALIQFAPMLTTAYGFDAQRIRAWMYFSWPEIARGQIWRLITPAFIHFDLRHLIGNMLWLYMLGGAIEQRRGWIWLALLCLAIEIPSTLAEVWLGSASRIPAFDFVGLITMGGMSGVVSGLFGYVWMKSRYFRSEGYRMDPTNVFLMIIWYVICLSGQAGPIANWAHSIGLATGILLAFVPRPPFARR